MPCARLQLTRRLTIDGPKHTPPRRRSPNSICHAPAPTTGQPSNRPRRPDHHQWSQPTRASILRLSAQAHQLADCRTRSRTTTTTRHLRGRTGSSPSCPGTPAALPTANPPDVDPPGPGAQGLPKQAAERKPLGVAVALDLRNNTAPLGCTNVVLVTGT
jgi:hypothetical protein